MNYREKLSGVLAVRTEVETNIEKLRDALYKSFSGDSEREATRQKLHQELSEATLAAAQSTVDAILGSSTGDHTGGDVQRITAELSALDAADMASSTLQDAIRKRLDAENEKLGFELDIYRPIAEIISHSKVTADFIRETREAWLRAIHGSRTIKYLVDRNLLNVSAVTEAAGTAPMKSVELFSYLDRSQEAKRLFPDKDFANFPLWSDAIKGLEKDSSFPLPGEKTKPQKTPGLFGK